jgi:hypothetical protein
MVVPCSRFLSDLLPALRVSCPPCTLCQHSEADTWLNDPAVRSALHAAPHTLTGPWKLCSSRIRYRSDGGSMLPVHDALVRKHGEHHEWPSGRQG